MNIVSKLATAGAIVLLSGGFALADCTDTTASITSDGAVKTPPMSKDGSQAPLEVKPRASAKAAATQGEAAQGKAAQKDGNTMPLATQEGGGNKNLATSQQDVEAQQHGDKTAAAKAQNPC